jgi:hypothetical protein
VKTRAISQLAFLCLALAPKSAFACAVCLGASDSAVRPAMNAAIFVMLGAIGSMLACVGGFMFYLNKRARTLGPDPAPQN